MAIEPLLSGILPMPLMQIVGATMLETMTTMPHNGNTIPHSHRERFREFVRFPCTNTLDVGISQGDHAYHLNKKYVKAKLILNAICRSHQINSEVINVLNCA